MDVPLSDRERAPIDLLISRILLVELDLELVKVLKSPAVTNVLEAVEPGVSAELQEPWDAVRDDFAREEYARLFLLPKGVPPFASAWIEGEREQLGSQLTTFVSRLMTVLDRAVEPQHGNLPLDHLGLLLELAGTAALDGRPSHQQAAAHLRAEALGPWVGAFGRTLQRQARLAVYRAVGGLLAQLYG